MDVVLFLIKTKTIINECHFNYKKMQGLQI